jgi:hypothetical protein
MRGIVGRALGAILIEMGRVAASLIPARESEDAAAMLSSRIFHVVTAQIGQ